MEKQLEYYVIGRVNNDRYPLLKVQKNADYEISTEFINSPSTMTYHLGRPIPKNPIMADYHSSPSSVISGKIASVLENMKIKGIQLIPAIITGKDDELFEDYFHLYIYNFQSVIDKENSVYDWDDFLEIANPIEELVLDNKALSKIPLEDRLIFRLQENNTFEIFHKSVVDAIMATNPEGIRFTKVSDWTIGTAFE